MNPKTVSAKWSTQRVISYIPLQKEVVAFRSVIYNNGVVTDTQEGLATEQRVLRALKGTKPIVPYIIPHGQGIHERREQLVLARNELFDFWRNNYYGSEGFYTYEELLIRNPYSHISQNGLEGASLVIPSTYDGNLYDLDLHVHPKALFYSYTRWMDNSNYDLEKVLEILRARQDISWRNDQGEPAEPRIFPIPAYNADHTRYEQLCFVWIPTEEDWNKISQQDLSEVRWALDKRILDQVLGLQVAQKERDK